MATKSVRIAIEGMSCDGCSRSVRTVLQRVPGVHRADAVVGSAQIEFDDAHVSEKDLAGAIDRAGFVAGSITPA